MDGVHDMGGMHGFGKVEAEQDEPVFHADWEARTQALYRAMSYTGVWVIDQARYARDKVGVIEALRGCHVFPDTVAIGKGEDPQWLYTVVFDGRELWGDNTEASLQVSIEAFEPYLEPA